MYYTTIAIPSDVEFPWLVFGVIVVLLAVTIFASVTMHRSDQPPSRGMHDLLIANISVCALMALSIVTSYTIAPKPSIAERQLEALTRLGFTPLAPIDSNTSATPTQCGNLYCFVQLSPSDRNPHTYDVIILKTSTEPFLSRT
jgi:hypothetical protein